MSKNSKKRELNQALTLIALVITIIVLLILAGVSIAMLTGENGLFKQATKAKEETKKAEVQEVVDIAMGEYYIRKNNGENITVEDFLNKKVESGEFDNVKNNGDGTYRVEKDGYETIVKDEEYNLIKLGDYVEYNVTYTDMYSGYEFTAQNGWRVLEPGTKNADGTYSKVKLISTGVPAKLFYSHSKVKDIENKANQNNDAVGNWTGNSEQREKYLNEFNLSVSSANNNIYASAGLYYNFEQIKLIPGEVNNELDNVGRYKKINNKTEEELSGKEFIVNGIAKEVHNLTLAELNKARKESNLQSTTSLQDTNEAKGLLYLRGLGEEYKYNSANPVYWLAFPNIENNSGIRLVSADGFIDANPWNTYGLRPVVSLNDNVEITKIQK